MIANLKSYPKMKDSGNKWLGDIPCHWELRRTKTVLKQRVEKGYPDEPLLAATQSKGVVRKDQYETRTVTAMKDLHLLKLVRVDDFVISLRSFQGGIEYARVQGIISPAYTVLHPINSEWHGYIARLFKSKPYVENLTLYVTGIRQGQNIDYEKLSRSELPIPPVEEQAAIVRYLDYVDRRIKRYVRAKNKLITLLEEQKQAIIHQAVTKGLNPNAPLKPSGIDWLGDIPEHWETARLGRHIQLTTGFPFKSDGFSESPNDIRLLRGINISPSIIRWETVVYWPMEQREQFSDFELQLGDIVLGMDRPIVKSGIRIATIQSQDIPSLLLQRVARIRVKPDLLPDYLYILLAGDKFSQYLTPIFTGISVPHLSPEQIRSFYFGLPSLVEQESIVDDVSEQTASIDSSILNVNHEISLLQEYRTRLIADVITGKLDVREAAANLPNEANDPTFLDSDDETATNDALNEQLESIAEGTEV